MHRPNNFQSMIKFFQKFPGKPGMRDLPPAEKLKFILGPGVILLATALGSGEIYFWPGITMKYGFVLIWPAMLALFLQYILNTEFARYTIATGETIIVGFIRLWRPLGIFFLLGTTLPWIWPGWSMGGATALSWVTGWPPVPIAVGMLVFTGAILTLTGNSYLNLEIAEKILISVVIVLLVAASVLLVKMDSLKEMGTQIVNFSVSIPKDLDMPTLLAALAFCGAGGTLNLTTSHWIKEKGLGMAGQVPVSSTTGYNFKPTELNILNWKAWWKVVRYEQFFSFFLVGLIGLLMLMLLSHSLVFGENHEIGMGFLKAEGEAIGKRLSQWMRPVFYLLVTLIFFSTAMGVIDHIARISVDILLSYFGKIKIFGRNISAGKLYFLVLWLVILFGVLVLTVLNISSPPTLLVIAGSLSGIVMFIYSVTLLVMSIVISRQSKKENPHIKFNPFSMGIFRTILVTVSILFYGWFSVVLIIGLF